jgi:hypothetical protein
MGCRWQSWCLFGCQKMVDSLFFPFSGECFFCSSTTSWQFKFLQLACGGVGLWWYFTYGPGALMAKAADEKQKEPRRDRDNN